jgi:hypothetical protein
LLVEIKWEGLLDVLPTLLPVPLDARERGEIHLGPHPVVREYGGEVQVEVHADGRRGSDRPVLWCSERQHDMAREQGHLSQRVLRPLAPSLVLLRVGEREPEVLHGTNGDDQFVSLDADEFLGHPGHEPVRVGKRRLGETGL